MNTHLTEELLNFYESLLRAQLNVIRQFKKQQGFKEEQKEKRMSHPDIIYDILIEFREPMHVDDIIIAAKRKFNIELDKESVVSALAKRIKRQDRFIKTAPNTYSLLEK